MVNFAASPEWKLQIYEGHAGEHLNTDLGKIGWLDAIGTPIATPGVPTARLDIADDKHEILVAPNLRIEGITIGTDLLRAVILRLIASGYALLVVDKVTSTGNIFFKEALKNLTEARLIESYELLESQQTEPHDDYGFRVRLIAKTAMPPDTEPVESIVRRNRWR